MKKFLFVALLLLAVFGWQAESGAVIGIVDAVPAATLLLPYFEVDLANPGGQTTLFSINASTATAVLTRVVLWTDLGVPVFGFHVYLTGYDVQTINLRDVLNGNLPQTASAGQDPTDTISPQGQQPPTQDINYATCTGILPPQALTPTDAQQLKEAFLGHASSYLSGQCGGINHGDSIARGYVTVDTINNCTLRFPNEAGYFAAGGTGDATNQNLLWGDYFHVNPTQNFAQGDTLVHIEASGTDPETSVAGEYTFYGRYVNWTAIDNREPLATSFGVRFVIGGSFTGGTSLLFWRDSKVNQGPFACPAALGVRPAWYPLGQEGIVIFDEQEHPQIPQPPPFYPPPFIPTLIPFGAAAGRTLVGGPALPVPYNFGWLYLNLNTIGGSPNPPEDPAAAQAWVVVVMDANGRYSVGFPAIQLDNAANALHFIP
jgi:hypothetical protein